MYNGKFLQVFIRQSSDTAFDIWRWNFGQLLALYSLMCAIRTYNLWTSTWVSKIVWSCFSIINKILAHVRIVWTWYILYDNKILCTSFRRSDCFYTIHHLDKIKSFGSSIPRENCSQLQEFKVLQKRYYIFCILHVLAGNKIQKYIKLTILLYLAEKLWNLWNFHLGFSWPWSYWQWFVYQQNALPQL